MSKNVSAFIATSLLASFLASDVNDAYAQAGGKGGTSSTSTSSKATGGSPSTGGAPITGGAPNGGVGGATGGAPPVGGMGGVAGTTGGSPPVLRRRYVGVPVQGTSWLRSVSPTGILLISSWAIIYSIFRDRKYEVRSRQARCL